MTPEEAAAELLRRRYGRNSLVEFSHAIDVPGKPVSEDDDEWVFQPVESKTAKHHVLIMDTLEKVFTGEIKNLMIFAPPGSAKSSYASVVFPAYALGKRPGMKIILASYASAIAWKQSRRTRQIVKSAKYRKIFDTAAMAGNASVEEWALDNKSEYMATGLLAGTTGNRANLILIDDPVSGREDAESETIRRKTREAYEDDLKTRLIPGGATVVIQCMVGGTMVLMADGNEKPLRDVRPGDVVATYEDGLLKSSLVKNWANQGPDSVFAIKMISGTTVKANARHPFLVKLPNGETKWVKTTDLMAGQEIVRATHRKTDGKGSSALSRHASQPQNAKASAQPTTTNSVGLRGYARRLLSKIRHPASAQSSSTVTASALMTTTGFLRAKAACVQFANSLRRAPANPATGMTSSALIIAMTPEKSEDCFATTATSPLGAEKHQKSLSQQHATSDFTLDEIVSIQPSGVEDVFDIEVDGTENFIANGLVSHNTRWHEDDLSGHILPEAWNGESGAMLCRDGQTWHVLCLPAIADRDDDPLGRKVGEPLWPEWFSEQHFEQFRAQPRTWMALFQQRPRPAEGAEFKNQWLQRYATVPRTLNKIITVDPSSGKNKQRGDYTSMWVIGLAPDGNRYILDCIRDRLNLTERTEAVFKLHRKWKPLQVRYEQYGLQADIEHIRAEQEKQQYRFQIQEVGGALKKEDRIRRLIPLYQYGQIYHPTSLMYRNTAGEDVDLQAEYEKEFAAFPVARHDDMMDSLARMEEPSLSLPFPTESYEPDEYVAAYQPHDASMGL